ncbi:MAG: peptidase C11 [Clostridia bacterium]|nr:peptidase C11 [Clostridia bacterium]
MNNGSGRKRNVTGSGTGMNRRGSGLGTRPVGRPGGYGGNGGSGGSGGSGGGGNRGIFSSGSGGGGKLIIIIVIAAVLIGGVFGLGNCLGCSESGFNPIDLVSGIIDVPGTSTSSYSGFTSSTVSSGWVTTANTGKLDTSSNAARSKYTVLKGNGQDTVTVMVYLCGTDLETKSGMATQDLKEMLNANLNDHVNVLVYTGGTKTWKNSTISNTVNQIYKITNDHKLEKLVANDGSDSMTKPATLSRFIQYCASNYPANRYELVLWDHGGGTISGYGYDEKNSSAGSMSLAGIGTALKNGGVKFDFVGYDACLMASLENGLMLDDYADYLIASEETEPGVGWYHTNWLTALAENPSIPTVELGKIIVDDYTDYCAQKCAGQKTTLSVIDVGELSATVPDALKEFATKTTELIQNDQYQTVSDARSSAREFNSNKIDQVDLVHFAYNLNTASSRTLAQKLLGAVKYNRTSSNMSNAYGISAYFPYRNASKVNSGVNACESVGVEDEYIRCIQSFASLETGGQAVASSYTSNPLSSLLGTFTGGGTASSLDVSGILGGLLGGSDGGSILSSILGSERTKDFITEHQFDSSNLVWLTSNGRKGIKLTDEQWGLVQNLQLNFFYDDGEGYVDLGCDLIYDISSDGTLSGDIEYAWVAIGTQVVPFYYTDTLISGSHMQITGRVPCLLNGERAELMILFDDNKGSVVGARRIYTNKETETAAKADIELQIGDTIDFVCDFYNYDGVYQDSYMWGDRLTYNGNLTVSDRTVDGSKIRAMYIFTDIYGNEFFSPVIPK